MPEIVHDIEALKDLQQSLRDVYKDVLLPQRGDFELSVSEAGHGKAVDAIESFYNGWNDGRSKVLEGLESMNQSLKAVVAGYEELEHKFSDAFGASSDAGKSSRA